MYICNEQSCCIQLSTRMNACEQFAAGLSDSRGLTECVPFENYECKERAFEDSANCFRCKALRSEICGRNFCVRRLYIMNSAANVTFYRVPESSVSLLAGNYVRIVVIVLVEAYDVTGSGIDLLMHFIFYFTVAPTFVTKAPYG